MQIKETPMRFVSEQQQQQQQQPPKQIMIPPTPTSLTTMPASKAKIGFSIDSIVGEDVTRSPKDIKSDFKYVNDYQTEIARALRINDSIGSNDLGRLKSDVDKDQQQQLHCRMPGYFEYSPMNRESSISPSYKQSNLPSEENNSIRLSRTPSPHRTVVGSTEPSQFGGGGGGGGHAAGGPTVSHNNNGPIRPLPIVPQQNLIESKQIPPYLNLPGLSQAHNPHVLQAQFQMAAALAQRHAEHGFPQQSKFAHHPPHLVNPNMGRDSYPLYPWLLSRHGRIFPHAFPGNFLLHPFRKPKRVRTAFSPSQLLKLEHAFESNQYVVGAERKALAQALNLSETQVKVWFQNRRTKHKRMQQEEDSKGGNGNGSSSTNADHSNQSYNEDELIDMDDCFSEDDSDSPH